jgi:hypothetical protein
MRLIAMRYNLMRVFEEVSKIQQPELIHPSDKKFSVKLWRKGSNSLKNEVVL